MINLHVADYRNVINIINPQILFFGPIFYSVCRFWDVRDVSFIISVWKPMFKFNRPEEINFKFWGMAKFYIS